MLRLSLLTLLLLLLLGAPAPAQGEDLAGLVADLGGEDSSKRIAAYNSLRQKKDPRALPLILGAVNDMPLMGRYYAVFILDQYPSAQKLSAFKSLVGSKRPYLRLAAAAALYQAGDRKMVEVVVRALTEEGLENQVRMYMINRLGMVPDPRVLEAVRGFVSVGEEISLLGYALNHLSGRSDRGVLPRCEALLEGEDRPGARAMAAAYLYRFGDAARAADLAREIRTGELGYTEFMRIRSFLQSARRADEEILDAVMEMLESETNVSTLRLAVELLGQFRHRKAFPLIKKLLTHENRLVAKAAFEALAGESGALDEGTLRPLLESEDADRRLWAAEALRRMDDFSGLAVALDVLKKGGTTQRMEAARVLGGFRDARVVEPLIDALMDEYSSARSQAASSLGMVLRALFPYRRLDLARTGYSYNGPEATRKTAADRIRAWWRGHRDRDW